MNLLLDNSTQSLLSAAALLIGIVGAVWLIRWLAARYVLALAAKTNTKIDDAILVVIRKTNLLCVAIAALWLSLQALTLPPIVLTVTRTLSIGAVFLQIALWVSSLISFWSDHVLREKSAVNVSAQRAITLLLRIVLWLLVAALFLENIGVRLTPLLAGAGIAGIATALALQNVLGDIFCYIAIILDRPFVAGDFIIVGDLLGTVERIGLRTTKVRSLSGELLVFANRDLTDSRIRNYKTLKERRVVFQIGVTYETKPDQLTRAHNIVKEVISAVNQVRLDRVHFKEFGDFSLNFEIVYYVLAGDYNRYMDIQQEINFALVARFAEEGIDFAYPTQVIYTKNP